MKKLLCIISIIGSIILAGCDLDEKYEKSLDLPLAIKSKQKLIIATDVGNINIIGNDANQTGINARIIGKGETIEQAQKVADAIKIYIETYGSDVTIKISKPSEIKNSWFEVHYTINVPKNIDLKAKADVGNINISNINGDINALCDVGTITCKDAHGNLKLNSDVGNINAGFADDANSQTKADLSVDVGNIDFKAPDNLSAKIDASADVGSISSAFPAKIEKDGCSRKLNTTIGKGEGNVKLKTDVGSIDIK